MKQIYHHYEKWEDFQAGMFDLPCEFDDHTKEIGAARLLKDTFRLYGAMAFVATQWRFAAEVNLSDKGRNRRAWLGQAACCLVAQSKEHQTKSAWHTLNQGEQDKANAVADSVIQFWERNCA